MKINEKPSVSLSDDQLSSFITASFSFRNKESRAGESCKAQLSLTSEAFPNSAPVTLSSLRIEFEAALKPIVIDHTSSEDNIEEKVTISQLTLQEEFEESEDDLPSMLRGESDLTIKPGHTVVLEMTIPLRESGEVAASSLKISYVTEAFDLDYTLNLGGGGRFNGWYAKGSSVPRLSRSEAHVLQVQPRPPKMEIRVPGLLSQYYASEPIELTLQLMNGEDETAIVKFDVHLLGPIVPSFRIKANDEEWKADGAEEEAQITGLPLGKLTSSSNLGLALSIDPVELPATFSLDLRASYHLDSDAATPIMQNLIVGVTIVNAFEANYDLVPRLHLDPWPSLFDHESVSSLVEEDKATAPARGLAQNWSLVCHYASFASEDLKIIGTEMKVLSTHGDARCNVVKQPDLPEGGVLVFPKTMHEARFDLTAQKLSLDDRHPVSLDLAFVVRWQRQGSAHTNTTSMPAGHYLVLGSEPRVLASIYSTHAGTTAGLLHLDVTIENPSSHFLTFGLSMDPSDEFAFSGTKQTTLHLLPMSRRTTTYRLLPLVRGVWVRPGLTVRDRYFQKTLRVIPTQGMKIDKEGFLVWVPEMEGAVKEAVTEEE